jgi:lipopolysaccharide transport system permease protein
MTVVKEQAISSVSAKHPATPRAGYEIRSDTRPSFQVGELWSYRHLLFLLAWRHIRVRYKQTVFGLLWAVIVPVAFTAIFVLFFGFISVRATGGAPYVPSAFAGLVLWQLFMRGISEASTSLSGNAALITKVYFPRTILPLAAIVSALFDTLISCLLLAVVLLWYGALSWERAIFAPLFMLQMLFIVVAVGFWLSAIDGLFRDLRHALPLVLQLGMFVSPVAYSSSALIPDKWRRIYDLNPLVAPLDGFRWALVTGTSPLNLESLIISLGITTALLISGAIFFAYMERAIVDRV